MAQRMVQNQSRRDLRRAKIQFLAKAGIVAIISSSTFIAMIALFDDAPDASEETTIKEPIHKKTVSKTVIHRNSTVAVLGDSHVGGLRPSLRTLAREHDLRLEFKDLKGTSVRYWQNDPELSQWLRSTQPRTVFIVLGTNDAMAWNSVPNRMVAFQRFVDHIRFATTRPPTIAWILPPKLGQGVKYLGDVRAAVNQLRDATIIDLADLLVPLKNFAHPTHEGYAMWMDAINARLQSE